SWVDSGLAAQSPTWAPPARSTRTRFAVSAVTCRQAAMRQPSSGSSLAKRSRIAASTGIWPSAPAIRAAPARSSRQPLIAVVMRLVRALHRHADVGRLLVGQRRQLDPEGVEVQACDLL